METMGSEFQFRDKIPVAILGATGNVGQRFVELLSRHPWFEVIEVAASGRIQGKSYGEVVNWNLSLPIPEHVALLPLLEAKPSMSAKLVFSALDSSVAGEIETVFAENGYTVISNAKNHRMRPDVPLIIPEVNSSHLELMNSQMTPGKIIANPNCSAIGLGIALKPLNDLFGIEHLQVMTMQSISGAGYPGLSSLDILDNLIPFIEGEEEKLENEPLKILGTMNQGVLIPSKIKISAQCNRVAVSEGHTECVSIKLAKQATIAEIIEAWNSFKGEPQHLKLPSAPISPITYFNANNHPQPRLHRFIDRGMGIAIGRLRKCPINDYKFVLLSHNTIRGAAGGAILCAELLVRKGHVFW